MMPLKLVCIHLFLFCIYAAQVQCQVDGSFWWNNKELLQKATVSRNNKRVDFKNEAETSTQPSENITDMDCTCMHKCRCQVVVKDSTGHCEGTDQVCCHIIKLPIPSICFKLEQTDTSPTSINPAKKTMSTTKAIQITTPAMHIQDRFIYPDEENFDKYPFLLELFLRVQERRSLGATRICGATLISKTSAITAQHCVRGSRFALDFMMKTTDGQVRIITQMIRHPLYYSGGLYNDLAIIQWDDPIRINDEVDIVDLPSYNHEEYENCSLGSFKDKSALWPIHEAAQLLEWNTCERRIQSSKWGPRFKLHENFTCIDTDRRASCLPTTSQSRDGNPLVCHRSGHRHPVLVGVMSWYSCEKAHPDVLMDIRLNLDWISASNNFYY